MDFKAQYGLAWYQTDERNENRKVNADGKGWLAYCSRGLLLVKRFDDLTPEQPAPDEAEVQVYVNRGKAHIELESQGAYQLLQPKESLSWTVRWYLMPYEGEAVPSEALAKQVRDIVGPKPCLAPVYLGIPYAKVERCMPPLPVDKWEGVRACDHWGPQAMQQTWGKQLSEDEMSEKSSCVLNVWTTDLKAKKPVMLWLHETRSEGCRCGQREPPPEHPRFPRPLCCLPEIQGVWQCGYARRGSGAGVGP